MKKGILRQVIGPTVDVEFPPGELPNIFNAIRIQDKERNIDVMAEVSVHIGDQMVRCIALSSTDGLVRGMEMENTGAPVTVPVGPETLGRIFNLLGQPIDELGPINIQKTSSIHKLPPKLSDQETKSAVFETGDLVS